MSQEWRERALCADYNTEDWFPDINGTAEDNLSRYAKSICAQCPVRIACLAFALEIEGYGGERTRFGIWGGMSPRQRAELVQKGAA